MSRPTTPANADAVLKRLALLKQQERQLRILCSQSHASRAEIKEVEIVMAALAAEIALLESLM